MKAQEGLIRSNLTIESILIGCEQTLQIQYNERMIDKIIHNSIDSLESEYGISFDTPLEQLIYEETVYSKDILHVFIQQLTELLKALSLLNCLTLYDREYILHLRDFAYLGFSESNCLAAFKILQDKTLLMNRGTFYTEFVRSFDNLPDCTLKRFLVIMAVFERIGVYEGMAFICQYIYMSSTQRV